MHKTELSSNTTTVLLVFETWEILVFLSWSDPEEIFLLRSSDMFVLQTLIKKKQLYLTCGLVWLVLISWVLFTCCQEYKKTSLTKDDFKIICRVQFSIFTSIRFNSFRIKNTYRQASRQFAKYYYAPLVTFFFAGSVCYLADISIDRE